MKLMKCKKKSEPADQLSLQMSNLTSHYHPAITLKCNLKEEPGRQRYRTTTGQRGQIPSCGATWDRGHIDPTHHWVSNGTWFRPLMDLIHNWAEAAGRAEHGGAGGLGPTGQMSSLKPAELWTMLVSVGAMICLNIDIAEMQSFLCMMIGQNWLSEGDRMTDALTWFRVCLSCSASGKCTFIDWFGTNGNKQWIIKPERRPNKMSI